MLPAERGETGWDGASLGRLSGCLSPCRWFSGRDGRAELFHHWHGRKLARPVVYHRIAIHQTARVSLCLVTFDCLTDIPDMYC